MPSNQSVSNVADFYGVYSYKDPLIFWMVENHDAWGQRDFRVKYDAFVKAYIKRLDEEIFTERPEFKPDIFTDKTLKQEWINERWLYLLTHIFNKGRTHSYCVVRLYDQAPYWRVFYEKQITKIEYDDKNNPIGCEVEWSRNLPLSDNFINFKEKITFFKREMLLNLDEAKNYGLFIPFGTPDTDDELGEYDLEDKWSLAINIQYALYDIVNNSAKSSGFYWLMYGDGISPKSRQNLLNTLDMSGTSRAIGAKESVLKDMQAMFPAKPEFSVMAIQELISQFAMACRLPIDYFKSDLPGGLISPSGEAEQQQDIRINKKKRAVFGKFREYIIDLVFMRWGIIVEEVEPFILETEDEEIETQIDEEGNEKPDYNNKKEINGKEMKVIND